MTEISDWNDLETQLQETRELLTEVEQRFNQVRRDSIEQQELQSQQQQLKLQIQDRANSKISRPRSSSNPQKAELQQQLQELSDRLEQIEVDLESRLLSWSSFREPFWQIVRFGGIGIIIGVILKSCTN